MTSTSVETQLRKSHPRSRRMAALAACGIAILLLVRPLPAADRQVDLLAIGDWGTGEEDQKEVASAMASYVARHRIDLDGVLLLGDNFYVDLDGGVKDPQWQKLFEEMYDKERLPAPFYAVLGNHDYDDGKDRIQLEYARRNPDSRFKLPYPWYRLDLPRGAPLVTLIALDSNFEEIDESRWSEQSRWLEEELSRSRAARWTVAFAHHPLFSNSKHGGEETLRKSWGPLLKKHDVDIYLAGHDHGMQHLEVPGWPAWFIISGGGGKELYKIEREDHSRFGRAENGFAHLRFTRDNLRVAFIDKDGETLYTAERESGEPAREAAASR